MNLRQGDPENDVQKSAIWLYRNWKTLVAVGGSFVLFFKFSGSVSIKNKNLESMMTFMSDQQKTNKALSDNILVLTTIVSKMDKDIDILKKK